MKKHHWIIIAIAVLAAVLFLVSSRTASAGDAARGRQLYESRCGACHSTSVHGRAKRVATDFAAVRDWVVRWNDSLGLGWGGEEIDDVAVYLNLTYYGFRCPADICNVVSQGPGAAPGTRVAAGR